MMKNDTSNQLEVLIISKFLLLSGIEEVSLQDLASKITIRSKSHTPYGFMSEFSPLRVDDEVAIPSSVMGSLRAVIDGEECDFLLYFDERCITTLEGYTTRGIPFPRHFNNIEVFELETRSSGQLVVGRRL
jgi:hypothetical protein